MHDFHEQPAVFPMVGIELLARGLPALRFPLSCSSASELPAPHPHPQPSNMTSVFAPLPLALSPSRSGSGRFSLTSSTLPTSISTATPPPSSSVCATPCPSSTAGARRTTTAALSRTSTTSLSSRSSSSSASSSTSLRARGRTALCDQIGWPSGQPGWQVSDSAPCPCQGRCWRISPRPWRDSLGSSLWALGGRERSSCGKGKQMCSSHLGLAKNGNRDPRP